MDKEKTVYDIYMAGGVNLPDGPRTSPFRALLGNAIVELGHNLLTPHVAYDYEQTTFRVAVGGTSEGVCNANLNLLRKADFVVAEATGISEGRTMEETFALFRLEIPVLMFRHLSDQSERRTSMLWGLEHPLLKRQFYTEKNLLTLLKNSIQDIPQMVEEYRKWNHWLKP